MSSFTMQKMQLRYAVPPRSLGNVRQFICDDLDRNLMHRLRGAGKTMVCYEIQEIASVGKVSYFQPEVLVDAIVDCYFYEPKERLLAEVVNSYQQVVQVLINGVFAGQLDKVQHPYPVGSILRAQLQDVAFKNGQPHIALKDGPGLGVVVGPEDQPADCDGTIKEFQEPEMEPEQEPGAPVGTARR